MTMTQQPHAAQSLGSDDVKIVWRRWKNQVAEGKWASLELSPQAMSHLGWTNTDNVVFSHTPTGDIEVRKQGAQPTDHYVVIKPS